MKKLLTMMLFAVCAFAAAASETTVTSPDGRLSAVIGYGDKLTYSVLLDGKTLIAPSCVSMTLDNGSVYGSGTKPKVKRASVDETYCVTAYKRSSIRDNYNQLTLSYKDCDFVVRAYNDGVAYRFVSKAKKPFNVLEEQAQFAFPQDWNMYVPYCVSRIKKNATLEDDLWSSFENHYKYSKISEYDPKRLSFLPLMVEASEGVKINIMESALTDYPGMYLYNGDAGTTLSGRHAAYPKEVEQGGHNMLCNIVRSREEYIAKCDAGEQFPWRIIAVSTNDAQMADSDIVYRLGDAPAAGSDWSWVKPGKVAWDWWNAWGLSGVDFEAGINTQTYKYYIDFASQYGIEYVILDEGWAVNLEADLMQVIPEIDMEEIIRYGQEKGVDIILWAGYLAFDRDMEKVCEHYSKMGVKGWKIDFMDRDDQYMVDFYRRAAETAAKYKMVVDFHGTFKPHGLNRTFPNVLNYEGVYGLENMKWAKKDKEQMEYDVTMPFIRMCAGVVDYTQGAMNNSVKGEYNPFYTNPMSQGTRCHQLGQYVVYDSPLNMLCDSPSAYMKEAECTRFIAGVPVVWDESVAVDGKVGEYIVTARRSGDTWFVGGLTDWNERDLEIDLSFLGEGQYSMEIFRDGVNAHKVAEDYKREFVQVEGGSLMTVHLAPGGGFLAKISPLRSK